MQTTFHIIRTADDEDRERLAASANRFVARHNIDQPEGVTAIEAIWYEIEYQKHIIGDRRLEKLWLRCVSRALREKPVTGLNISYGSVGYWT